MKVYLDLVFFLNFCFDFLLLLAVSLLLRRNTNWYRFLLGALIGSISIFSLFLPFSSTSLFLFKVFVSIMMVLVTFGFRDFRYTFRNLGYLYMSSIILGGFLYFLNIQFSYKQEGIVFYHHGLSINFIILIIFSPIILYIYVRQAKRLKHEYQNYYEIDIPYEGHHIKLNAFLDTGNKLVDPYKKRPIILVHHKKLEHFLSHVPYILVPYHTVGHEGMLKCVVVNEISIKGIGVKRNVLIGLLDNRIHLDGVNCILNSKILEESYVN